MCMKLGHYMKVEQPGAEPMNAWMADCKIHANNYITIHSSVLTLHHSIIHKKSSKSSHWLILLQYEARQLRFIGQLLCSDHELYALGAQQRLKSLGGPRFGSQHGGACVPHPALAGLEVSAGGSRPSRYGGLWVSPPKFFLKTQMLNPAFWWLLRSLVGSG